MSNRRNFIKKAAFAGAVAGFTPAFLRANEGNKSGIPERKRALRIAHITDVHITDLPNAEMCFRRVIKEINALKDKPDLIINTGDSVMDENRQTRETVEKRWSIWNKIVTEENRIPIRSALGNHDVWYGPDEKTDAEYKKDKRYGKQWAIDMLKLPGRYYSFDSKGWKFIALDSINGEAGYQLDDEQFGWLEKELKNKPANVPVCVFNHVPLLSMGALLYATKRKPVHEVTFPSGDMHNDHQRIKDLFHSHNDVKVCLSGHVHYIDSIEYLGVKYLCNGAVSGNWWGSPLMLDEFPPVYTIIDLYNDGSSNYEHFFYRTEV